MCEKCPAGTTCPTDAASSLEELTLQKGFWRISAASAIIYACPMAGACAGGTNFTGGGADYCAAGHRGFLCDVGLSENEPDRIIDCRAT